MQQNTDAKELGPMSLTTITSLPPSVLFLVTFDDAIAAVRLLERSGYGFPQAVAMIAECLTDLDLWCELQDHANAHSYRCTMLGHCTSGTHEELDA